MALALAVVLGFGVAALAQDIPGYPPNFDAYDPREMALLPPYCKYTQLIRDKVPGGSDPVEGQRWQALLGPSFVNMHHYCWGLIKANRGMLLARSDLARTTYLSYSISEFDYVIERAPADFILLPEVLTKKGEVLIRLGKGPIALVSLERAAELKPDYWPPYAHMADYYKGTGNAAKAREMLKQGLSFSPNTPALTRRLEELDSKPARVKPAP